MFCRNCGNPIDDLAAVCVKCGVPKGQGANFCPNCGAATAPGAAICTQCGVSLGGPAAAVGGAKSKMAAGLLGIFLGTYGVHNFYLGYTNKAIVQVVVSGLGILLSCFTLGITLFATAGISIWGLVEGIMILTGSIKTDGKGNPLA